MRTAFFLAFLCNFALLGSSYVLRPVRDAMATVFGVDHLQNLFTGTLVLTLLCSPLFAWLTDTFKISRVVPGDVMHCEIEQIGAMDVTISAG